MGLLSDRTVLRSKMEGLCPDKFRVVELSRVYHTIPQSASKTKKNHRLKSMALFCGWRMTHPGLHFSSSCEFPKCSCWACLLQTLPGTSAANWNLSLLFINEYWLAAIINFKCITSSSYINTSYFRMNIRNNISVIITYCIDGKHRMIA